MAPWMCDKVESTKSSCACNKDTTFMSAFRSLVRCSSRPASLDFLMAGAFLPKAVMTTPSMMSCSSSALAERTMAGVWRRAERKV